MSVLIKGMKMPKSCMKCDINCKEYMESSRQDIFQYSFLKRLDNCPLVEIPEKHGRLIDGDYLYDRLKALGLKDENVFRIIKEEPIVIESEE